MHRYAERGRCSLTPLAGLVVAGLAIAYAEGTGKPIVGRAVLGPVALRPLVQNAASYTVGALLLLVACKWLAYTVSLGSFRGGPIFPSMFIGAAGRHRACPTCPGCRWWRGWPWASARCPRSC